jgi:hypothetical protein
MYTQNTYMHTHIACRVRQHGKQHRRCKNIFTHTYTYIYIHIHTYTYIPSSPTWAAAGTYLYTHAYTYIYIHTEFAKVGSCSKGASTCSWPLSTISSRACMVPATRILPKPPPLVCACVLVAPAYKTTLHPTNPCVIVAFAVVPIPPGVVVSAATFSRQNSTDLCVCLCVCMCVC